MIVRRRTLALARGIVVMAAVVTASAPSAALQAQAPSPAPVHSAVLIDGHDLAVTGAATLGAAALSRLDQRVARAFSDSAFHARHPGFAIAARRASLATETALMLAGGTVWAVGRINEDRGTSDVAFHTTAAVASGAMFIQVVRGVLGRSRPNVIADSSVSRHGDPYDFQPFHGFTSFDYRSFPSMHAMASFAAATALTQEMRRRETPHRRVLGPLLYSAAAMPALARMYMNEHWASDVAMGIFIGVLSGQKVVNYSHDHPDNRGDRPFLQSGVRAVVTHDARGFSLSLLPF